MTFSYTDPSANSADKVRFLLGDTDEGTALFSDEEIGAVLSEFPDPYETTVVMCEAAASKYARKMDKSIGGTSLRYSQLFDQFTRMAEQYRRMAKSGPAGRGTGRGGGVRLVGGGPTYLGPDDSPRTYTDDYGTTDGR